MGMTFTYAGGTARLIDLSVTVSWGISPQVHVFRVGPAGSAPLVEGDLTFGVVGSLSVTLRDCRIAPNGFAANYTAGQPPYWNVAVEDRRWRWVKGYAVNGHYNQRDDHEKLRPKTVRSPTQLATLLLAEMGETGYDISALPPGLAVPTYYTIGGTFSAAATYTVTVNGVAFSQAGAGLAGMADVLAALADAVTASTDPAVIGQAVASAGDRLAVSRADVANPLTVSVSATGLPAGGAFAAVPVAPGPKDVLVDPTTDFLNLGANVAQSFANPTVAWLALPAARALADLAEQYRQVVAWDVFTDTVAVRVQGDGPGLPDGPLLSTAPSLDLKTVPRRLLLLGAEVRSQVRLLLEPVGQDWDQSYRRLSDLSYAPERPPQAMRVVFGGQFTPGLTYTATVNGVAFTEPASGHSDMAGVAGGLAAQVNGSADPAVSGKVTGSVDGQTLAVTAAQPGYEFEVAAGAYRGHCPRGPVPVVPKPTGLSVAFTGTYPFPGTTATFGVRVDGVSYAVNTAAAPSGSGMAWVAAQLAAQVNAGGGGGTVTAVAAGGTLTLSAAAGVTTFLADTGGSVLPPPARWAAAVSVPGYTTTGGTGLELNCQPPLFAAVVPTDRLSYLEAQALARASVYRFFRPLTVSPYDRSPGIPWPGRPGRVTDLYGFILLGTRPEQVAPRPPDAARLDPVTLKPIAETLYDGYSKDRPPAAWGSVFQGVIHAGVWAKKSEYVFGNSPAAGLIHVPFGVKDAARQILEFAEPIYRVLGDTTQPPGRLVVEVGAVLLDPVTHAPVRFTQSLDIPGGTGPAETIVREDCRQEVIGEYDERHQLTGYHVQDADAVTRASYYLQESARRFVAAGCLTNTYGGLRAIPLGGQVRQVTWSLTANGPATTASAGTEHSQTVTPYPTRRYHEGIAADPVQAAQNLTTKIGGRTGVPPRNGLDGR